MLNESTLEASSSSPSLLPTTDHSSSTTGLIGTTMGEDGMLSAMSESAPLFGVPAGGPPIPPASESGSASDRSDIKSLSEAYSKADISDSSVIGGVSRAPAAIKSGLVTFGRRIYVRR